VAAATISFLRCFWGAGDRDPTTSFPDTAWAHLLGTIAVGLLLLWVCQRVFARLQDNFAQEL